MLPTFKHSIEQSEGFSFGSLFGNSGSEEIQESGPLFGQDVSATSKEKVHQKTLFLTPFLNLICLGI
jgi:hypothetical protein